MRLRFSEKANRLYSLVKPYIEYEGIKAYISDSAPKEIKKAYKEWCDITDKEYMQAMGY